MLALESTELRRVLTNATLVTGLLPNRQRDKGKSDDFRFVALGLVRSVNTARLRVTATDSYLLYRDSIPAGDCNDVTASFALSLKTVAVILATLKTTSSWVEISMPREPGGPVSFAGKSFETCEVAGRMILAVDYPDLGDEEPQARLAADPNVLATISKLHPGKAAEGAALLWRHHGRFRSSVVWPCDGYMSAIIADRRTTPGVRTTLIGEPERIYVLDGGKEKWQLEVASVHRSAKSAKAAAEKIANGKGIERFEIRRFDDGTYHSSITGAPAGKGEIDWQKAG